MFGSLSQENESLKKEVRELEIGIKKLVDECQNLLSDLNIPEVETEDYYCDDDLTDYLRDAYASVDSEGRRLKYVIGSHVYDVKKIQNAIINKLRDTDKSQSYRREDYYTSLLAIALNVAYKKNPSFIKNIWYKIGYQFGLTDEQSQALFRWCLHMGYPYSTGLDGSNYLVDNKLDLPYTEKEPGEIIKFDVYDTKQRDADYKLIKSFDTDLIDYLANDVDDDYECEIVEFYSVFDINCYYDDEDTNKNTGKVRKKTSSKYDYNIREELFDYLSYDDD